MAVTPAQPDEATLLPAQDDAHPTGPHALGSSRPAESSESRQPACILCGSGGELHYEGLTDRHFSAPGTWSLLTCPRCKLAWLSPRPRPEDLDRLYRDYYTHDETGGDSLVVRAIRRGIPAAWQGYRDCVKDPAERILGRILGLVGPLRELAERGTMGLRASQRGELLDVGCGNGQYLAQMRDLGWRVSGVERDPNGAGVAAKRIGDDRIHADLAAANTARRDGYDVVTLSHVIEHLLDPIDTLVECRRLLRPGGLIVIATPNFESLGHRQFKRNWLHLDPPRHIQLYTTATLSQVVERAGFSISRITTPSSSAHFLWRASSELTERGRLPDIQITQSSPGRIARSIGFWAREYTLTRMGRPCGEELLLVAENPR